MGTGRNSTPTSEPWLRPPPLPMCAPTTSDPIVLLSAACPQEGNSRHLTPITAPFERELSPLRPGGYEKLRGCGRPAASVSASSRPLSSPVLDPPQTILFSHRLVRRS
jgi:hypothetical protein